MTELHPTRSWLGYGDGAPGEYYFSRGMTKSQNGIKPQWNIENLSDTAILNFITRADFSNGTSGIYGLSQTGVYNFQDTLTRSLASSFGIIGDQKNRLLYLHGTSLGKFDGSSWVDGWKTMTNTLSTGDFAPMETYEDCVLVGLNNALGRVNGDDSINDQTSYAFHLPTGFKIRAIKANKNGILIGANLGMQGILALWDNISYDAITPWIWLDSPIQTIVKYDANWIVITGRDIYLTNGYSIQKLKSRIDMQPDSGNFFTLGPQGATVVQDKLILATGGHVYMLNRFKAGLQILDLKTLKWEYSPYNGFGTNSTGNAIFTDTAFNTTYVNFTTNVPFATKTGKLTSNMPSCSYVVTEPLGKSDNNKTATAVKLELGVANEGWTNTKGATFTVDVKTYNFKKPLWGYAKTNGASTSGTEIKVDGTAYTYAEVGDEITIQEGLNAGEIRHISSIANGGTNTEMWTLDEALPNNTETNVLISVQPFKRTSPASTQTNVSEIKELFFPVNTSMQGKRFLTKIVFTNMSGARVELKTANLIYEDQGVL